MIHDFYDRNSELVPKKKSIEQVIETPIAVFKAGGKPVYHYICAKLEQEFFEDDGK